MHAVGDIEWAVRSDHDALADVLFDAVRRGPSLYTERQRAAWAPSPRRGDAWAARLDGQAIAIARNAGGIAGFISLAADGYVDFAYIRPEAQGTGLFRRLFTQVERLARERGEPRLWVHASLMAQPAFAAMGFTVVEHETVEIAGERLERVTMEKVLRVAAWNSGTSG